MSALASESKTDLALLWDSAFTQYNQTVGDKGLKLDALQVSLVRSVEDVTAAVDESCKAFKKYRHDGSTVDSVRSFIGGKLSYVQIVGDKVSEAAVTSFPPVGAIWTVCTYAIKTCQTMSQDYNQLLALIGEAGNFLKTLEIIEKNVPDCKRYTEFVTATMTAIIGVFAVQTKFMLMKRPMAFLHTLVRGGGDNDLEAAYSRVTEALSRLSRANEMMTIKNTEDIKTLVGQWGVRMEFYHDDIISELQKQNESIQANHEAIVANQIGIEANQQGIEANRMILEQIRQELVRSAEDKAASKVSTSTDSTANVSAAFLKAKAYFAAKADPEVKLRVLSGSFATNSTDWLFSQPEFQAWLDDHEPFLWLIAEPGQGKSHLAFSAINHLKTVQKPKIVSSVAYFFFQEELEPFRSSENALNSIGLQVAAQDRKFRDKIASKHQYDNYTDRSIAEIWEDALFSIHFGFDQTNLLFIVLDGLEVAERGELVALLKQFDSIRTDSLRIKVLFTGTEALAQRFMVASDGRIMINTDCLQLTKVKMLESRLDTLPRLSRFRPATKNLISKTLLSTDFSLLYLDRLLKTMEARGLERLVIKSLKNAPDSLSTFYAQLLAKCLQGRDQEEREALRFVLSWLGICHRTLTLQELNALVALKFGRRVLNIEEEVVGKCASILDISNIVSTEAENNQKQKRWTETKLRAASATGEIQTESQKHTQSQWNPSDDFSDSVEDDSNYVVFFQDTTLTQFVKHGGHVPENESPFTAHLDAFTMCTKILQVLEDSQNQTEPSIVLRNYAAFSWIKHLKSLDEYDEQLKCSTDEQVVQLAEALTSIYGASAAPTMNIFKQTDVSYDDFVEYGCSKIVEKWMKRALAVEELNPFTRSFVETIAEQPHQYLRPLVTYQFRHWVFQVTREPAEKALTSALKAYQTKDGEKFDKTNLTANDIQQLVVAQDIRMIPYDFAVRRATAIALSQLGEYDRASDFIQSSWEALPTTYDPYRYRDLETEKFYTLFYLAEISSQTDVTFDKASQYYDQALALRRYEDQEERETTKDILVRLGIQKEDTAEGADLLQKALITAPDPSGICFSRLLQCLNRLDQHEKVVETVTRYGSLRLTMAYTFGDYVNEAYQKSAKRAEMTEVMLATYKQLIYELDPLKWASPAKFYLARAYRRVVGDLSKAKELLYQILDAESCIHPALEREDDSLLYVAQTSLSEILYKQFSASPSLSDKSALLREMNSLQNRKLGQKASVDNFSGSYTTLLARMYQKLGPYSELCQTLDDDFHSCMDVLQDDDPWNDCSALRELCKVLAFLPELEEDAAIALCASFYLTDPEVFRKIGIITRPDMPSLTDEPEEQTRVYDYASSYVECAGCGEAHVWNRLTTPMNKCAICVETSLCDDCLAKLQEMNQSGSPGPYPYCDANHSYIKAPIAGWQGIREGKIYVKGREPLGFTEWLRQVREERWPHAWETMTLG